MTRPDPHFQNKQAEAIMPPSTEDRRALGACAARQEGAIGNVPAPSEPDDFIADEIKDALRRAPNFASVNATAVHFKKDVAALERSDDPEKRIMAIQIKNLATYRRLCIREGWG